MYFISLLLILFTLVFPSQILANTWTRMPVNGNSQWQDLTGSIDGVKLAAFITNGYVYTTSNSGNSWMPKAGLGRKKWSSIAGSANGSVLLVSALSLIGGDEGDPNYYDYVYLSTDYGFTFTKQTVLGANNWKKVLVSDDGMTLLAMASYSGNLHVSTDGGVTWQTRTPLASSYLGSIAMSGDGENIVLFGEDLSNYNSETEEGEIVPFASASSDSGATWSMKPAQLASNVSIYNSEGDMAFGGSYLYARGAYKDINDNWFSGLYVSTDLATSWTELDGIDSSNLGKIKTVGDGQHVYSLSYSNVSYHVQVYHSSNYGEDWALIKSFDESNSYYPAAITISADASKITLALSNSFIFSSTDSGVTWVKHNNGTIGGVWNGVDFSSDGSKLLASTNISANSMPKYSIDGGQTWSDVDLSVANIAGDANPYLISPDGDKMFMSIPSAIGQSSGAHLFSTINLENAWTNVDSLSMLQTWQDFSYSKDASTLYGVCLYDNGGSGHIYSSSNWGANWTQLSSAGAKYWGKISSSGDGSKIMATVDVDRNDDYVYYSTDSGSTWNALLNSGSRNWSDIAISSDGSKMYAADSLGYIYKSVNDGVSWTELTSAGSKWWQAISSSSDGSKLIAAAYSSYSVEEPWLFNPDHIYTSIDSGETWTEEVSLGQGNWVDAKISLDGGKFIVADSGGFVYVGSSIDLLSSTSDVLAEDGIVTNLSTIVNQSQACDLYFEKVGVGKIEFSTCPDLTDPTVVTWVQSLNNLLNLSLQTISLDADMVQGLISTRATLTMYNINMSNPQILVNDEPDTQGVVSNLVYDSDLRTLTFNAAHFTTFTAIDGGGTPTPTSSPNSSSSSVSSANTNLSCGDDEPNSAPDLFQIDAAATTAKLFFTPISNTNSYYVSFSTSSNAEEFGTGVVTLSREGVQNFTISHLKPNTTYYFKVRGQLGCKPGDWSQIMKIKTNSKKYYKNLMTQFSTIGAKSTVTTKSQVIDKNLVKESKPSQGSTSNQDKNEQSQKTQTNNTGSEQKLGFWQKISKWFGF